MGKCGAAHLMFKIQHGNCNTNPQPQSKDPNVGQTPKTPDPNFPTIQLSFPLNSRSHLNASYFQTPLHIVTQAF